MIQFNRGLQSSLPNTLSENELYLTDDTGRLIDGTTGHIVGEDVDVLKVGTEHQHLGRRNSATVGTTNFVGLSGFYYSDIADNGDGTFTLYFADPHPWDATIGQTETMNANAYHEEFFSHYESGDNKFGIVVYKRFTNVEYLDSWYEDPDTYAATFTTPNDDEWATCITKTKEQLASEFSEFNCCIYDPWYPDRGRYYLYRDSFASGNCNDVKNAWASAFGYANIVDGMFGTAVGRNNEVNYAAFGGGRENKAHGWYSAAIGRGNTAAGLSSVALGEGNTSTGSATASFGVRSKATAKFSIAGGHQCETLGNGSAAFGNFAKTGEDGDSSFSAGYYSYTNGIGAVALGHSTNAMRVGSFASGMLTHATGDYSTAMGYNTTAEGVYSFTAGLESNATGQKATALSWHTTASGNASVATGYNTTASGSCSFTTGQGTEANGKCSVATGYYTRTSTPYSIALGQFNKPEDNALLMVGYGTNDGNRKNVFTVSTTGVVTASRFAGTATKAENDATGNNIENTYVKKTDVIPLANGGTGIKPSSLKDLQCQLINYLEEGSSAPKDADFYIAQYAGGGTGNTSYYRRPHSALYSYIKGKTDTLYSPISHTHSNYSLTTHNHDSSYAAKSHVNSVASSSAIGHVKAGTGIIISSTGVLTCRTNLPTMFEWANFVKVREEQYDLDSTTNSRSLKIDGVVVGFVSIEGACVLTTHTPGSSSSTNYNYEVTSTIPGAGDGEETHISYRIYYVPFAGVGS